jgi:hypothetical protein
MSREVFVSYCQSDCECAFELVSRVEAHGINTWIAPRDVSPSADWAAEIIDAIAAARVMVLVLSANSNDSPQVRREVERAVNREVRVLAFRIDDVLPSKSLEYFLSSHHWLDAFPPPREPYYARLCAALDAVLKTPATRPPPAEPVHHVPAAGPLATDAAAAPLQPHVFDSGDLQKIEARLAQFIGPVAKVLVRRAAARSANIDDLTVRLAAELDSEPHRHQFIASCHGLGRPHG